MKPVTISLPRSLAAAGSAAFEAVFKHELARLGAGALPLHHALSQGNHILDEGIAVIVLSMSESAAMLCVKAGIHFRSIIAGCACDDDPTPVSAINEYGEFLVTFDRRNGDCTIAPVSD